VKLEVGSWKLEVGSWKLRAGSCNCDARVVLLRLYNRCGIQILEVSGRKFAAVDVACSRLRAGGWKLEVGSWFEVAGWKVEVGSWKSVGSDVNRISYTVCLPEFAGIGRASDMLELCDPVVYELLGLLAPT
jgi:hypothetical protein